jgi:Fe-S-cluster containining protein
MLSPEEQAEFLSAMGKVRQAALHHLDSNRTRPFIISFISNLHRGVDSVVRTATHEGEQLDCKAGCSHCCRVRVEALEPEIVQIANELKKLSPEKLDELTERLRNHATASNGVSVFDHHITCPFLEDDLCSIYQTRPAVCRKAHSFDVKKCNSPGSEIPQSLEIALKSEALMKGTAEAYQRIKLSASGHELGKAVLRALTDETAESRWSEGEEIFD